MNSKSKNLESIGWKPILLLAVAVLFLLGLGLSYAWHVLSGYRKMALAPVAARKSVRSFLDAAGNGDCSQAYQFLAESFQKEKSIMEFCAQLRSNLADYKVLKTQQLSRLSTEDGTITLYGSMKLTDGRRISSRFVMSREGRDWHILDYDIGTPF